MGLEAMVPNANKRIIAQAMAAVSIVGNDVDNHRERVSCNTFPAYATPEGGARWMCLPFIRLPRCLNGSAFGPQVLALVLAFMGVPSGLQLWFGKPKVLVQFEKKRFEPGAGLIATVTNPIISNRFLKRLGVYRLTVEGLRAFATITESGSGRVVCPQGRLEWYLPEGGRGIITNLSSGMVVKTTIIFHSSDRTKPPMFSTITNPKERSTLEPGAYICKLELLWANQTISRSRSFTIWNEADRTDWNEE